MEFAPPFAIPRLRTDRLLLREYRPADFDAFAANLADPVATRFIDAADRKAAWRMFGCQAGLWVLHGAGWWTVELAATGELVGHVGAFFREGWPEIELGWNTYRNYWGKGYASEAAREMMRYAFDVRKEKRVTALIEAENKASVRVAERLGLQLESETELFGKPVGRYVFAR